MNAVERVIAGQLIRDLREFIKIACYKYASSIHSLETSDLVQICNVHILDIVINNKGLQYSELIKIAKPAIYNKLRDIYRTEKKHFKNKTDLLDALELPNSDKHEIELNTRLDEIIDTLDKRELQLLLLLTAKEYRDYKQADFAVLLNTSVPTISRLFSSLHKKLIMHLFQ